MVVEEAGMSEEGPSEPRRPEKRGQKTIKHEKMTEELWSLAIRAAKRLGIGVNEWVCDVMRSEAERQLGMEPPPPAREALAQILRRLDDIERNQPRGGVPEGPTEPPPAPQPPQPRGTGILTRLFEKKRDD
jgi:hypothetical protein